MRQLKKVVRMPDAEYRKRISIWLVSSLTRLNLSKDENALLFLNSEVVESNLVKLETGCWYFKVAYFCCLSYLPRGNPYFFRKLYNIDFQYFVKQISKNFCLFKHPGYLKNSKKWNWIKPVLWKFDQAALPHFHVPWTLFSLWFVWDFQLTH